MEWAKNAEYDSARCADHEKVYISLLKNQFLWSKFFRHKKSLKKVSLKLQIRIG